MKKNKLFYSIIVSIVFAVLIGGFFPGAAPYGGVLGAIFLKLLMMIVVPLVIFSMITGITGLGDLRKVGKMGTRTIVFYLITTALSVLVGIFLVTLIEPGKNIAVGEKLPEMQYRIKGSVVSVDAHNFNKKYDKKFMLILKDQKIKGKIDVVSQNKIIVKKWICYNNKTISLSTADSQSLSISVENNVLIKKACYPHKNGKGIEIAMAAVSRLKGKEKKGVGDTLKEVFLGNKKENREGLIPGNVFKAMVNMEILPLIFFSILIGLALASMNHKTKTAIEVLSSLNDAIMKIVDWIMLTAPIGIFGIIVERIGRAGGFEGFLPELFAVGSYALTVILGLLFHGIVTLPLIYFIMTKKNPFLYLKGMLTPLLNAFSTASSSATLPLTMEAVQNNCNVSKRTSGFVLPIGATINMDGTALYEAVAAIFIAQVYGISLGPVEQIIIFLTATLAAIGAAGIPEAGLVTMVIVLRAVGLPLEGVGLILTIDWFLDRCRTTINVWGDSVGAGVIDYIEDKNNLKN